MANMEVTTTYANAVKTQYERRLLTRAAPRLIHARWGLRARVNRGMGSLEFRKYGALSAITTALTEGVTPDEQSAPALSVITITPVWYGAWLGYTDKLDLTGFDPIVMEASGILGDQAGLSVDTLTRNTLVAGATDDWSNGVAARASLSGPGDKISYADFLVQLAELEAANARPVDGSFKVIIHPYTWSTLMQDSTFVTLFVREGPSPLRSGLVGRILNCDVFISSNAASYASAGAASETVYSALFIGAESYGVYGLADLTPNFDVDAGGPEVKNLTGRPVKPVQIIMKELGSAGTLDPLNQRGTLAWKTAHVGQILDATWIRDLEHINDFYA